MNYMAPALERMSDLETLRIANPIMDAALVGARLERRRAVGSMKTTSMQHRECRSARSLGLSLQLEEYIPGTIWLEQVLVRGSRWRLRSSIRTPGRSLSSIWSRT